MSPPKPPARAGRVSIWQYARLFRRDILSAQPAHLYRAKMAEFRTLFFRSYFINQPGLIRTVLVDRPMDFPKSDRVSAGLRPLLGNSVFLTNGAEWERQRRIINPAFEGGRLRDTFAPMQAAAQAMVDRIRGAGEQIEIEEMASFGAADVIFRTLFSIPIDDKVAAQVYQAFRSYQRAQPILNLAAILPLPGWFPKLHNRKAKASAQRLRALIAGLTEARMKEIEAGTAPDDLATKIMTQTDPQTGHRFGLDEMVDQVAIFFLAGHETSAAALGWALYLLAQDPAVQGQVAQEVCALSWPASLSDISELPLTRDVFREALRLYPPVPMMVREATKSECFRDRDIAPGAQVVISPWHLHRNPDIWENPDEFEPGRYEKPSANKCLREGFIPFSAGARTCPGAGFALVEGALFLAALVREFRFETVPGRVPVPVAHLTVRAADGIWLKVTQRRMAGEIQVDAARGKT